ncbi:MAG: hypothetical protein KAT28_01220 [Candidatus Aenigmarchaeota archaeon]|nr:hypothetical protein [Candidatus Aenigmarchaeota archaeon]
MKTSLLEGTDNQIAETNRYLMQFGEAVPDPRAIEMVKETGQYAKNRGMPVSDYVHSNYDTKQLTKLLAKGASEEDLKTFYENPIKSNINLDTKDYNFLGTGESNNYNINLKKFFEMPTEKKVNYLSRLKNFGKTAIPIALAASLLAAPVAAVSDSGADIPEDWYDETKDWFFADDPSDFMGFSEGYVDIGKSLDEPIRPPDEVMKLIENNINYEKEVIEITEVPKSDLGTWMAVASEETVAVCPQVALVDTNGDGEFDALYAMYLGQRDDGDLTSVVGVPREFYDLDGNKIDFKGNPDYLINPFDTLDSDDSNIANLLYFKDPSMINFGDKPTAMHWKDALEYKTVGEIFGEADNTPVSEAKVRETEIYKEPIGEESAEKMVEDMRTDTATEKEKTNPLIYLAGLGGLAGIGYLATRKKSGQTPTAVA